MARINVEDTLWSEIGPVIAACGDQDKAIGNVIRFFKFAQEKHKKGKMVSEEEFQEQGFLEALFPIFAKRTPSGIECRGAEKHFNWLAQKVEAGSRGGKKSATRKRDASGRFGPGNKNTPSEHQAEPKHSQPSFSPSPSPSSSRSSSDSLFRNSSNYEHTPSADAPSVPVKSNTGNVVKLYCELWKSRYKSPRAPDIRGPDAGKLQRLVKDVGEARACKLVEAFLQMPDQWFVTKSHSIDVFIKDLTKVGLFADSGKMVTKSEAQQLDRRVTNENIRQQLKGGKI